MYVKMHDDEQKYKYDIYTEYIKSRFQFVSSRVVTLFYNNLIGSSDYTFVVSFVTSIDVICDSFVVSFVTRRLIL